MSTSYANRTTWHQVLAEVMLVVLTLVSLLHLRRLFFEQSWGRDVVATALIAHLTLFIVRRLGRGIAVAGGATIVMMVLSTTWLLYSGSTNAGLPTGLTRDLARTDIQAAWDSFQIVQAPTLPEPGFVLLLILAVWVVAFLADWAAFRLWSPVEAILPTLTFLVFAGLFGTTADRVRFTGFHVAAVLFFAVAHRVAKQARTVNWLGADPARATNGLLRAGGALAAFTLLAAVIVGPALPGADEQAIVNFDGADDGVAPRVVVSPLVDIRGRLVQQADVEVFTVEAAEPAYWRLTSLDTFDGAIWRSSNKFSAADGEITPVQPSGTSAEPLEQRFVLSALAAVWLPSAFDPINVESDSESIRYDDVSSTLIVDSSFSSSDGLDYTVTSRRPRFDPDSLSSASGTVPTEIAETYLGLPDGFANSNAAAVAAEITTGTTNNHQRALALQSYFRNPNQFTYSLDVGEGHSSADIDTFLENGVGYCEQFAGSFAAMARSLGMPARVAVGFTWGDTDPEAPGVFRVRGEHAHAWPEVYIDETVGWVAYEPTPGRGNPGAANYTGIEQEQDDSGPSEDADLDPIEAPDTPITPPVEPDLPDFQDRLEGQEEAAAAGAAGDGGGLSGPAKTVLFVIGAIALIAALYIGSVLGLKNRKRAQQLGLATSANRGGVGAAWLDAEDSLRLRSVVRAETESPERFADRAAKSLQSSSDAMRSLGAQTTVAMFAPEEPEADLVSAARSNADAIIAEVNGSVSTGDRWKDQLDPRPLLKNDRS